VKVSNGQNALETVSYSHEKGEAMKKTLMALGAVAVLATSTVAIPAPAHAQRGVAAGVAAGLIGGAIVGGAIASQHGYYGPGYYGPSYYAPGPAYVVEPGYGPECYLQLVSFIFIKSDMSPRKTASSPGRLSFAAEKNRFLGPTA